MLNLIKKELIITRIHQILGIILIFTLGPLLLSINDKTAYLMFTFLNLLIVIMICNTEMLLEIMKRSDIIMTSLPLRRDNIIKSKYIIYGLYPFISSIILYLVVKLSERNSIFGEISKAIGNMENGIGPDVLVFSLIICLIYISISMPLYYLLGEKSRIIGYILLISLFIIPNSLFGFSEQSTNSAIAKFIFSINRGVFPLLALGITFAIYLISMKISIKLYNKKEF